jgi:hypothetical protein
MTDKRFDLLERCRSALKRVDSAIQNHKDGKPEDLSLPMLLRIRSDLWQMVAALSPAVFKPSYPRFILDWPDEHGLIRQLSEVAYEYDRTR